MNRKSSVWSVMASLFLLYSLAAAQLPEAATPTKQHEWLRQFVGRWEATSDSANSGDGAAVAFEGTMEARMLGGLWVVNEVEMDMGGSEMHGVQTIGFDEKTQRYVGTWVDSMMNHMWSYDGTVDSTGKILTMSADGPNMTDPSKTAKYRDVYEFKTPDQIVIQSSVQGDDGEWTVFMTGVLKRKAEKPAEKSAGAK
jgi:hypothetical protein